MKLIIGNKRISSWSLRPWLVLTHFDIPFEEILIPLDLPDTSEKILKYSPTAKVPALIDGEVNVWDSLAIVEYLNEKYPQKNLWPADAKARAHARSISAEMHSGFAMLRQHLSHDLQRNLTTYDSSPAREDIDRIKAIWTECLTTYKGPHLFGEFSIADAMFAPVVNRFISYAVKTEGVVKAYVETIRNNPAHQMWIKEGMLETYIADKH